jgi:hypothetical protein
VTPLEAGAAAVVGQALNPLLEVPMPIVFLVPIKVPVVPCSVAAAVRANLTATAQVAQAVWRGRRRGKGKHASARSSRRAVGVAATPKG